jgi:hypothetical protein
MEEKYYAKAYIKIGNEYKEVKVELTKEQKRLLDKGPEQSYSIGTKILDASLEDYPQT